MIENLSEMVFVVETCDRCPFASDRFTKTCVFDNPDNPMVHILGKAPEQCPLRSADRISVRLAQPTVSSEEADDHGE